MKFSSMATISPICPSCTRWIVSWMAAWKRLCRPESTPQLVLAGLLARRGQDLDAAGIDAVRLLDEDVLAGVDRRLDVHRMELGRAGDEHDVDAACDDLLVAVEAHEAVVVVDLHLARASASSAPAACPARGRRTGRHMATSRTAGSAVMASLAAPLHRPPQPTMPMRITSLPAAWALRARLRTGAAAAAAIAERCRNCRREREVWIRAVSGDSWWDSGWGERV